MTSNISKSRTIDNLGIDASNQYARNQKELELDRHLIEESRMFPAKAEIAITEPYVPAETFEQISIGPVRIWATFMAPNDYSVKSSRLFSYQFIPSMGSSDRLQAISDKLETMEKTIGADPVSQHEFKACRNLISTLIQSFRTHDLIKARCNQYHRG